MKSFKYYFNWGPMAGRDIDKLFAWVAGKAHWVRFGKIEYNADTKLNEYDINMKREPNV